MSQSDRPSIQCIGHHLQITVQIATIILTTESILFNTWTPVSNLALSCPAVNNTRWAISGASPTPVLCLIGAWL